MVLKKTKDGLSESQLDMSTPLLLDEQNGTSPLYVSVTQQICSLDANSHSGVSQIHSTLGMLLIN